MVQSIMEKMVPMMDQWLKDNLKSLGLSSKQSEETTRTTGVTKKKKDDKGKELDSQRRGQKLTGREKENSMPQSEKDPPQPTKKEELEWRQVIGRKAKRSANKAGNGSNNRTDGKMEANAEAQRNLSKQRTV